MRDRADTSRPVHFLATPRVWPGKPKLFRQSAWKRFGENGTFECLTREPALDYLDCLNEWHNALAAEALLRKETEETFPYHLVRPDAQPCGVHGPTYDQARNARLAVALFPIATTSQNGFQCEPYVGRVWCFDLTGQDQSSWPSACDPEDGWEAFENETPLAKNLRMYFELPQVVVAGCSWQLAASLAACFIKESSVARITLASRFIITGAIEDGAVAPVHYGNKIQLDLPRRFWLYPDVNEPRDMGIRGFPVKTVVEGRHRVMELLKRGGRKGDETSGKAPSRGLYYVGRAESVANDRPELIEREADRNTELATKAEVAVMGMSNKDRMALIIKDYIADLSRCGATAGADARVARGECITNIKFFETKEDGMFIELSLDDAVIRYAPASKLDAGASDPQEAVTKKVAGLSAAIYEGSLRSRKEVEEDEKKEKEVILEYEEDPFASEDPFNGTWTIRRWRLGKFATAQLREALARDMNCWLAFAKEVRAGTVESGDWIVVMKNDNEARAIYREPVFEPEVEKVDADANETVEMTDTQLDSIKWLVPPPPTVSKRQ